MKWTPLTGILLAALLPLSFYGCNSNAGLPTDQTDADSQSTDPVPVEIITVENGLIEEYIEATGNIYADSHVTVYPKASGQITRMDVNEGDRVRQNQTLAVIDDSEHILRVRQLEITLQQAREKRDRTQQLFDSRMVSKEALDDAIYRFEDAEISLKIARLNLDYTRVKSPINGFVTARHIGTGDLVGTTSPAFEIIDPESLLVDVFLPEREAQRLQIGMPAKILPDSLPDMVFKARVLRINPAVDPRTGVVKVTLSFDSGVDRLSSGMFVRARIQVEVRENALLLPKRTLLRRNDENRVFVFRDDGTAEQRFLTLGLENMHTFEVIDGLEPGEQVVIVGQHNLEHGQPVKVIETPVPTPASDNDSGTGV